MPLAHVKPSIVFLFFIDVFDFVLLFSRLFLGGSRNLSAFPLSVARLTMSKIDCASDFFLRQ